MPNPVASGLPNPQSYDTTTAGVAVDNVTSLTWQAVVSSDLLLWADAKAYCDSLILAGADDWRLPRLIELVSIVDFSRSGPSVDVAAFSDRAAGNFWTATVSSGFPGEAFYLSFGTGFSYHGHANALALQARCVRGGTSPVAGARYAVRMDGTVLDTRTRLTWQRMVDNVPRAWASAADFCRMLSLAGGGWRVPSMKELQTLIDFGGQVPTLDASAFPSTPLDDYWTSSTLAGSASDAWYVSFRLGTATTIDRNNLDWVRCTR